MSAARDWCFPFFHDWGKYEETREVGAASVDGPTVAQRRTCKRCNAVHYRRVLVTNQ